MKEEKGHIFLRRPWCGMLQGLFTGAIQALGWQRCVLAWVMHK